jgi:hypothetical protein
MIFTLWSYVTTHTICIWFYTKYVTKRLELQNSIWFSLFKLKWPPSFKKTYIVHFKTNLNDFCGFECTKCRFFNFFLRFKNNRTMTKDFNSESQIDFINLNQTMTPFTSKEHILFISKTNPNNFCGFECVKCKSTKSFWGSK